MKLNLVESKALNMKGVSLDLKNRVFRLCSQVALEEFEDGALLLRIEDHRLFELNPTGYRVLVLTDGQRSACQVANTLTETYQVSETEALQDTLSIYAKLYAQQVLEIIEPSQNGEEKRNLEKTSAILCRYIRTPDTVLYEEDAEGGFLINPNTNQVKVLNVTGLYIWKQCNGARDLDDIVTAMQETFNEVPTDRVAQDVQEFVEEMMALGFIDTVENAYNRVKEW